MFRSIDVPNEKVQEEDQDHKEKIRKRLHLQ
jgi:hypothetical protein